MVIADFRESILVRGYPHVEGYHMQASEKLRWQKGRHRDDSQNTKDGLFELHASSFCVGPCGPASMDAL